MLTSTISQDDRYVETRHLSVLSSNRSPAAEKEMCIHLTPRQLEILALLCEGLPNKLICRRLNISGGTVKAHISSILRALGVTSRLQAVVEALSLNLAMS